MFALFFSLYCAMLTGSWTNFRLDSIPNVIKNGLNQLGLLVTSIFNDNATPISNFGDNFTNGDIIYIASLVLATITSIGIVVMAVKGIKRVFSVFFMGIR